MRFQGYSSGRWQCKGSKNVMELKRLRFIKLTLVCMYGIAQADVLITTFQPLHFDVLFSSNVEKELVCVKGEGGNWSLCASSAERFQMIFRGKDPLTLFSDYLC